MGPGGFREFKDVMTCQTAGTKRLYSILALHVLGADFLFLFSPRPRTST